MYSETFEKHVQNLRDVLKRLLEKGIKLRPDKCVFRETEVRYLGRLLSGDGYCADPGDTVVLENFHVPPKNIGELRSSLGFLGYYRSYCEFRAYSFSLDTSRFRSTHLADTRSTRLTIFEKSFT